MVAYGIAMVVVAVVLISAVMVHIHLLNTCHVSLNAQDEQDMPIYQVAGHDSRSARLLHEKIFTLS
jgi:hypothetical protein